MNLGVLDTVSLAATLVFALPVALLGVDRLVAGDTLVGGAFVAVGVLMVVLQEWLTTPSDLPTAVAQRVVGRVATTDDEEERP